MFNNDLYTLKLHVCLGEVSEALDFANWGINNLYDAFRVVRGSNYPKTHHTITQSLKHSALCYSRQPQRNKKNPEPDLVLLMLVKGSVSMSPGGFYICPILKSEVVVVWLHHISCSGFKC